MFPLPIHENLRFALVMLFLLPLMGISQESKVGRCGFDHYMQQWAHQDPNGFEERLQQHIRMLMSASQAASSQIGSRSACTIYKIPVVVHVVYNDDVSNISDAQIQSQIDVLNADYRHLPSSTGFGSGVDTRIQFCLASLDPSGNPTNGITRTASTFSVHKSTEEGLLKGQINWDDRKYLNIWVVKSVTWIDQGEAEEILGYASFPGGLGGPPDGLVIAGKFFGTMGSVQAPYNLGRTCTHEVGHFLGLLHPFSENNICPGETPSNCQSRGDFVCDTPPGSAPTYDCPPDTVNTCMESPCDRNDLLSNYMNFTDDICMRSFTFGQAVRMEGFLNTARASLHNTANLIATGCFQVPDIEVIPQASIGSVPLAACAGTALKFTDHSRGCVENRIWKFEGGMPAQSSDETPIISYAQAGTYRVSLIVRNSEGADTISHSQFVQISASTQQSAFKESFESIAFTPSGWQISDEDAKGSWIRTRLASSDGQACAAVLNYGFVSCNSYENLSSRVFDLSQANSAKLTFDYAYQAANQSLGDADQLLVQISEDCGSHFITLFEASGVNLATVSPANDAYPFFPNSIAEWKTKEIDLSTFAKQSGLRIRFRVLGKNGQNLFLDHIKVSSTVGLSPDQHLSNSVKVFPNPINSQSQIELELDLMTDLHLSISDIQGRILSQWAYSTLSPGLHNLSFPDGFLQGISSGYYFLQIQTDHGLAVKKLLKP